ncbi:MAG TPA: bifunctional phosphopantothenoylcysteine decarboxylase/phosphopantothenate--cysteine ligase CoaBC [Candidatus Limnocylindrales bacterium]
MTGPAGRLQGRRLALGITGSIAAYKAVDLLRLLQAEGADVRVLMTPSATAFIGPLTLETLSRHPVDADVLALQADSRIGHISAAHDVEAIVVAPATAHWIGAMAHGLAADSISAACLATSVPVVVAPAMDGGMYSHPATQANVDRLREFGYSIVDPESGPLASGMVGQGRLATLSKIVDATVEAVLGGATRAVAEAPSAATSRPVASRSDLAGRHVVVTAGGTAEPIDPVRFVGNRSSGKMGMAIAEAALARGAAVTLILGNVSVEPPTGAHVAVAVTAAEMESALRALTPAEGPVFDVLVMAAAIADFRPRSPSTRKMSRTDGLSLDLEATPDILAEVASRVRAASIPGALRPILVGFAAEIGSLYRATAKLQAKGVDLLVANDVAEPGSGFGTDTNRVTIYAADGPPEELPLMSKRQVAELLLDRVVVRLDARVPEAVSSAEERR